MSLKKAHGEKKRLRGKVAQDIAGDRCYNIRCVRIYFKNAIIADDIGFFGDMLFTNQYSVISGLVQRMYNMLAVVAQRKAPVSKSEHTIAVRVLTGQKAGPAG